MSLGRILTLAILCQTLESGFTALVKPVKYDLVIKGLGRCEDAGTNEFVIESNKLRRYNRTLQLYSTNLTVPVPMSDMNTKAKVDVAIFGNGGWKNNYFMIDLGGPCLFMNAMAPRMAKVVMQQLGIENCPAKPGTYTLTDLPVLIDSTWPSMQYSQYRADLKFLYYNKLIGCKRVFVDVVPKKH